MKKLLLGVIIICGLSGLVFGLVVDSNKYPFILTPNIPYENYQSKTERADKVYEYHLTPIENAATKQYIYLMLSTSCADINIYLADGSRPLADLQPSATVPGQDIPCKIDGSYTSKELTLPNSELIISSTEKFNISSFQAVNLGGKANA